MSKTAQAKPRKRVYYAKAIETIKGILAQYDYPLTVRAIYYRLISPPYQMYSVTIKSYKTIQGHLREARIKGDVDWQLIEDPGRPEYGSDGEHKNTEEHILDLFHGIFNADNSYDKAFWLNQPKHVEVWVEKNAVASTISQMAKKFKVKTLATRGDISWTKLFEARERFETIEKPIVILHLADHDPKGVALTPRLRESFARIYEGDLTIERVLLNYDQVQSLGLTPHFNRAKKGDNDAPAYIAQFGDRCWEIDAIPPKDLQTIVGKAIIEHIDGDIWDATWEECQKETKGLSDTMLARKDTLGVLATEILHELGYGNTKVKFVEEE